MTFSLTHGIEAASALVIVIALIASFIFIFEGIMYLSEQVPKEFREAAFITGLILTGLLIAFLIGGLIH